MEKLTQGEVHLASSYLLSVNIVVVLRHRFFFNFFLDLNCVVAYIIKIKNMDIVVVNVVR